MIAAGLVYAQRFDGRQLARRMLAVYEAVRTGGALPAAEAEPREARDACAG